MQIVTARPYPADWPVPGTLDLSVHDLPHRSSSLEWWYVNSHFEDELGRRFSFFASFFQIAVGTDAKSGEKSYAHALTWSLIDADGGRYLSESLVDRDAAPLALERLNRGLGPREPRLQRALREVLEKGRIPRPDLAMRSKASVAWDRLDLDYDGRRFQKLPDGRYRLQLMNGEHAAGIDLTFSFVKPVVLHGDDGVVSGTSAEDMFYYFCPRCDISGSVTLDGAEAPISSGWAWYDHEFGAGDDSDDSIRYVAWNWLSTQLDNGSELTVYDLFEGDESRGHFAVVIDVHGRRTEYREFDLVGSNEWMSTRTFSSYPMKWRLTIPGAEIELEADAVFPEQEFITFISKSAFWEGRVTVRGTVRGAEVSGMGFVERANFGAYDTLDEFYGSVSRATRESIARLLPDEPGEADIRRLVWSDSEPGWSHGVAAIPYRDAIIRPIRSIADRGGKSWRSYCALVCCDAVGGDSTGYADWMALPELLHVGSLIVDDVQDNSTMRRGGPPAHEAFGLGPAINAGNFCYFLPHLFFQSAKLSDRDKLRLYDLYMHALRAAHAGQGLDLAGADDVVAEAVETGNGTALADRVLAVHRLKSAAPAAVLAQIGGLLGGGNEAQMHALGVYFQQIGIAFQVVDDVLNLRGFDGDLKNRGEDIAEGKVTIPVAKALTLLPLEGRRALWRAVAARPTDPAEVGRIIGIIDQCGALDACDDLARALVEEGWRRLDPILSESYYKLNIRAFGWYVLERHY